MSPEIGPAAPGRAFPPTRYSVVRAVVDPDPEVRRQAFAALAEVYWKPVYKYLRVRFQASQEDAADRTQDFFARALEKGTFGAYDPERALFRTFLRTCLDRFATDQFRAARQERRGGGRQAVGFDFPGAEAELARQGAVALPDMDEYFHREWVRSLFAAAVEGLRARYEEAGKGTRFALFESYDLADDDAPRRTYAELGAELGLTPIAVNNELHAARRDFKKEVLRRLAELTASDAEYRAEARYVLGVDPP
jgi:RNA polymerase sigma factor (sigma-70 family)